MIAKLSGVVWEILPASARRFLVRATQANFTVSAAAVITNSNGEVLLLDHVLRKRSGWSLPGGFIDRGEQPEAGIRREVREETGIVLHSLRLLDVRTINSHIEILFASETDDLARVESLEIRAAKWFNGQSLPAGLPPGQKSVIKKVLSGDV